MTDSRPRETATASVPPDGSAFADLVGRLCITPYDESAGLMLVQSVYFHDEWMARGLFVGDHPHGYADGSPACYHASGLRPTVLSVFGDGRFGREPMTTGVNPNVSTADDRRPFPVQGELYHAASTIPWWLAEIAYAEYAKRYGKRQTLERLGKRGGFGREELIALIRGGHQ